MSRARRISRSLRPSAASAAASLPLPSAGTVSRAGIVTVLAKHAPGLNSCLHALHSIRRQAHRVNNIIPAYDTGRHDPRTGRSTVAPELPALAGPAGLADLSYDDIPMGPGSPHSSYPAFPFRCA